MTITGTRIKSKYWKFNVLDNFENEVTFFVIFFDFFSLKKLTDITMILIRAETTIDILNIPQKFELTDLNYKELIIYNLILSIFNILIFRCFNIDNFELSIY